MMSCFKLMLLVWLLLAGTLESQGRGGEKLASSALQGAEIQQTEPSGRSRPGQRQREEIPDELAGTLKGDVAARRSWALREDLAAADKEAARALEALHPPPWWRNSLMMAVVGACALLLLSFGIYWICRRRES